MTASEAPADAKARPEARWPALIAIAAAILIYSLLPTGDQVVPRWILPVVGLLMLVPLLALNPHHFTRETSWSRWMSIGLAALLALANQVEVVVIVGQLVNGAGTEATVVLLSALQVWVTNVIAFALIFWELDRGGPFARRLGDRDIRPDFRFPQEDSGPTDWAPAFVDYLYTSLSNQMAFSATDAMPLTTRAKGFMAFQAFTGFVLLALVISRAVNILA
jgi:hypothetical protein